MNSISDQMSRPVSLVCKVGGANAIHGRTGDMSKTASRVVHQIKESVVLGAIAVISAICFDGFSPAFADSGAGKFLVAQSAASAPVGATDLCAKYRWACASSGTSRVSQNALMPLATSINSNINRQTRTIADQTQ